jgi:hypothetical protein
MSGAAGIAAAKNRRSKPDPSQSPVISCSNVKPGSLSSSKQGYKAVPTLFDEESLQITGPMHVMQVLKVHEQRLNKIDDKINKVASPQQAFLPQACVPQACVPQLTAAPEQACDAECYERLSVLEEKVLMLEEVIMNLQLTLTNVQSFAMESSLAMLKLQNQLAAAAPTVPAPLVPAPLVPAPLVSAPTVSAPLVPAPLVPAPTVSAPLVPEVDTLSDAI